MALIQWQLQTLSEVVDESQSMRALRRASHMRGSAFGYLTYYVKNKVVFNAADAENLLAGTNIVDSSPRQHVDLLLDLDAASLDLRGNLVVQSLRDWMGIWRQEYTIESRIHKLVVDLGLTLHVMLSDLPAFVSLSVSKQRFPNC